MKEESMSSQALELEVKGDALILPVQDKWERLLQLAIERNAGAEQFGMLVDAITKARKEDARLQFESALGQFKSDLPAIFKTKKVSFANKDGSKTEYSHAELEQITEIIGESLRKYGLTHSWKPSEGSTGRTIMTCVFRHPLSGHVEEMASLGAPPDTSGGKNNVQAIGSTVTYLERYSLLAACGIAPKGVDNDGRTPTNGMPDDAITDYCIQMQDASVIGPKDEKGTLQSIFAECFAKALSFADRDAQNRFRKVYEESKRALRKQ
jgi:hypothetical protein